ncbi:N-acetyltransferase family protein [Antarcticibacterium flavum]|uniref:N-acetyltransferase family protein n=1 Tax=Antarcticibacterium flavum TaxID=2058175 RepID=A0A5B7X0A1_9FLAO|nr:MULTISPECIES: GNAT family N-acetyltransferase [Antarcticibacterium]MCM4160777.1 N-acetyltransferase [Antarcticibacterium sp. W02-3]QCY68749.1 N-acetyltransferase family protein [Antarcticibacterium flavum]
MAAVTIRPMVPDDWYRVREIYEAGIATGIATFETTAPTWEDWDRAHLQFSRLVSLEQERITGWAALSPVSGRCVYGGVAEVSVYVDSGYRGKGKGKYLLNHLITESENNGIWTLQAGLFPENTASLKIHLQSGFRLIGDRVRIGKLHKTWKDNLILEKRSNRVGID